MKISSSAERIRLVLDERHWRQADLLEAVKPYCEKHGVRLGKSALSQYISGKSNPDQDKTCVLSMALNVSEPWLLGYDVDRERKDPVPEIKGMEDDSVLGMYQRLTESQKEQIKSLMKTFLGDK